MAAVTHAALRTKRAALLAEAPQYQRGDRTLSLQKSRRRRVLRLKHVIGLYLLASFFFLAFERAYFFFISWDELAIRTVRIRCQDDALSAAIEGRFGSLRLGNILLFDLNALQNGLQKWPWIKDVRVRKVFPSSIRIDVIARKAFVLLEDGGISVVDGEGVVLEKSAPPGKWDLPVVRGRGLLDPDAPERWESVKIILARLPLDERSRIRSLECSPYGDIALLFEDDPLRILVDAGSVPEKLALLRSLRADWEGRFGTLSSADLRFSDRVILSPSGQAGGRLPVNPDKETD